MFKPGVFANSQKTRAIHGRSAGLHKIKMNAKNSQPLKSAPEVNHAMRARDFGIPQHFFFKEVDENSLAELSNKADVNSIDLTVLKKEFKKQENILKRMSLEHALHYLFPVLAANERKLYHQLMNAVQSNSPEAFQPKMLESILQKIKNVNAWLKNYVSDKGVQLCWNTPKFIYLPDGIPMPGKEDTHIVCPFFSSKKFKTEPALNTGDEYLLAKIDLEEVPFIKSKFSEVYVRNLAMTLQQRIENDPEKTKGASLLLSGMPSENLLNWFRGSLSSEEQKTTDQSPVPDIEVIYVIPTKINQSPYLFTLKPSRASFRLKKSNKIKYSDTHKKMHQTLAKERVRMIVDDIILQARDSSSMDDESTKYDSFIRFFWKTFEKCLNPYQTLEIPSSNDFEKEKEVLQNDLRVRLSNPYVTITEDVFSRAKIVACQERKEGYYYLDWNHIISDSRTKKDYFIQKHNSLEDITNDFLSDHNRCGIFSRAPAILMIRNKSENNNRLMVCASSAYGWTERVGVIGNTKKTTKEPLVEYVLFNMGLFYAQLNEFENQNLEDCCVAIMKQLPSDYLTRLNKFIRIMLKGVKDEKEGDFSFSAMISDMNSRLVSALVNLDKFKLFFTILNEKITNNSLSKKPFESNAVFENENKVAKNLLEVVLLNGFLLNDMFKLVREQHAEYITLKPGDADFEKFDAIRNKLNPDAARKVLHIYDVRWETKNLLKYIYVVMTNKTVRIALECLHTNKRPTHSELANAEPILAGGELVFKKEGGIWKLITVNNGSGHYRPPPASLSVAREHIPEILRRNGIDCTKILYCSALKPDMAIGSNVDESLSLGADVDSEKAAYVEKRPSFSPTLWGAADAEEAVTPESISANATLPLS